MSAVLACNGFARLYKHYRTQPCRVSTGRHDETVWFVGWAYFRPEAV